MSRIRGRRFVPAVLAGGALSAALLAASTTGTLSGFVATIQNSTDTASSGTLTMQEQNSGATVTCTSTDNTTVSTNSATCSTINKYGGNAAMTPGQSVSTTITIKNTGTVAASSFTLLPGACAQSNNGSPNGSATDLCSQMTVSIASGANSVMPAKTLAAFYNTYNASSPNAVSGAAPLSLGSVAAGATVSYTFTVTLPSGVGNTYQGLTASQPLTWTFNS